MGTKRVSEMTAIEKAQARKDWEEAERKVRGKPTRLTFPKVARPDQRPNRFDREHCDGCERLLARGSLWNVQVEDKWQSLCLECRRRQADRATDDPALAEGEK